MNDSQTPYPHGFPFVMAETVTGAAVCIVIQGDTIRFHDAEADPFPGPVIATYNVGGFIADATDGATLALRLDNRSTWIDPETYGVIAGWARDEETAR